MLGLNDTGDEFSDLTGDDFADSCLGDPALCENGLTVALWLKLCEHTPIMLQNDDDDSNKYCSEAEMINDRTSGEHSWLS